MRYNEDYQVDLWDRVEVKVGKPVLLGNEFRKRVFEGVVKARHPKAKELSVTYDTGDRRSTTGNPIFKTARFSLSDVELIARDG